MMTEDGRQRTDVKNPLPPARHFGYLIPATEKNVAGLGSPNLRRTAATVHSLAVFLCPWHGLASSWAALCGEPQGSPVPRAGLPTRIAAALFAFGSAMGGSNSFFGGRAMKNPASSPSAVSTRKATTLGDIFCQLADPRICHPADWSDPAEQLKRAIHLLHMALEYQWECIDYDADKSATPALVVRMMALAIHRLKQFSQLVSSNSGDENQQSLIGSPCLMAEYREE